MLVDSLPQQVSTFDVVTHSRGGLVLRNLVERSKRLRRTPAAGSSSVAACWSRRRTKHSARDATAGDDTIGWFANLLEMFPDNPFTTGASFVANGLVWLANHASGDLPGLHSMDGDGE